MFSVKLYHTWKNKQLKEISIIRETSYIKESLTQGFHLKLRPRCGKCNETRYFSRESRNIVRNQPQDQQPNPKPPPFFLPPIKPPTSTPPPPGQVGRKTRISFVHPSVPLLVWPTKRANVFSSFLLFFLLPIFLYIPLIFSFSFLGRV